MSAGSSAGRLGPRGGVIAAALLAAMAALGASAAGAEERAAEQPAADEEQPEDDELVGDEESLEGAETFEDSESFEDDEPTFDDELLLDDGLDALLDGEVIAEDTPEAASMGPVRGVRGFVEIRPRAYFFDRDRGPNDEQLLFDAELEVDLRFAERLSGFYRQRVFLDVLDDDLQRFEPFEAYLTYEEKRWDVRVGQFVENWGIVDTYNPIDVVNRRDIATDFLDPDRLGELGARVRALLPGGDAVGEPTISVYAIPLWRETLFPTDDQRFGFGSAGPPFREGDGFEPSGSERGFYAARFASTLNTPPVNSDVQLLVSRGPERIPAVVPDGMGALVPDYFGALSVGGGFRAVPNEDVAGHFLSTLTFKAEVVYKNPYTLDGSTLQEPDEYVATVVGIDREFYDVLREQDALTTTVEYAREDGAEDPTSLFRLFRNDVVARVLWEVNDFARSSVEVRGIYDFDTNDGIFEAIYETQLRFISENLKLTAQLQLFSPGSGAGSLLGFFPNNSSFALGLRYAF